MLSLVPEPKRAAVVAGLKAAFGVAELDAPPVVLTGGLSGAVLLRIRVGGIDYALKIDAPPGPFSDVGQAYACMGIAADIMLAPRVWHADPEAGIAILDLVPQRPFSEFPGGREALLADLAQTVRALHQAPAFPRAFEVLDGVHAFLGPDALAPHVPAAQIAELFTRHDALRTAYRSLESDRVSSHLDLNPANIIFDGRRVWLIDWYSAFVADRYADLAALANWMTGDEADLARLTSAYFGAPMDGDQAARLHLMRQANHLFLGAIFLLTAAGGPAAPPADLFDEAPLLDFRRRMMTGTFDLAAPANRIAYGRARLAEALANMRSERFAEALDRVAA